MKLVLWMSMIPMTALGAAAAACSGGDNQGDRQTAGTGAMAGAASTVGVGGSMSAGSGGVTGTGANGGAGGANGTGGTGGVGGTNGTGGTGGVGGTNGTGGTGGSGSGNAITDDFERATLGSNWEVAYPTGGDSAQVHILADSDLGMLQGNQAFFLVDWVGDTFTDNQYCEATISPELPTSPIWQEAVYVRRRTSDGARYQFGYDNDPLLQYQRWYLKYDGVAPQDTRYFGLSEVTTVAAQPGDTLRIEVVGYTLRGYRNGVLMVEATDTDASKIASGRPGLAARLADGNSSLATNTKVWESFAAGDM